MRSSIQHRQKKYWQHGYRMSQRFISSDVPKESRQKAKKDLHNIKLWLDEGWKRIKSNK